VQGDAQLLARARDGDPDAFAALIRPFDHGLRGLAFRLLGTSERMDDALQEAYVRAFRGLPRFRGQAAFSTWLYRIAYNACQDELRRSRWDETSLRDVDAVGSADPGDAVARRLDLARALAALPFDLRAVVLLVDAEGMDYREAGEVLGIPPGTVGSRLNRARVSLRAALAPAEEVTDRA
jgi:RNA polymerase sigma-70 factor (ECF subfamily)